MSAHAHPRSIPRLAFLALLALCLLAKPMAAFAAGLHEDLHAFAHALVHEDAGDEADDHPPAGPDDAEHDPVTGLHALMHLDFCCGVLAVTAHDLPVVHFVPSPALVPVDLPTVVGITRARHFRPPITA